MHRQASHVVETLDVTLSDIASARFYNDWIYGRARPYLGRRTLDVGAGIGTFTARAAADGIDVVAVEPEPELADRLERAVTDRPNVRVVRDTVESLGDVELFDSAMCFNVLEHLSDETTTLAAVRSQLTTAGSLLVLVPAHPALYGPYDASVGHVRRYTKRALRSRLEHAGFDVVSIHHVNPLGALGWLVRVRLLRQSRWPSRSFRLADGLTPVLRPLDRLRLPFGLSLWAVAQRG